MSLLDYDASLLQSQYMHAESVKSGVSRCPLSASH